MKVDEPPYDSDSDCSSPEFQSTQSVEDSSNSETVSTQKNSTLDFLNQTTIVFPASQEVKEDIMVSPKFYGSSFGNLKLTLGGTVGTLQTFKETELVAGDTRNHPVGTAHNSTLTQLFQNTIDTKELYEKFAQVPLQDFLKDHQHMQEQIKKLHTENK